MKKCKDKKRQNTFLSARFQPDNAIFFCISIMYEFNNIAKYRIFIKQNNLQLNHREHFLKYRFAKYIKKRAIQETMQSSFMYFCMHYFHIEADITNLNIP